MHLDLKTIPLRMSKPTRVKLFSLSSYKWIYILQKVNINLFNGPQKLTVPLQNLLRHEMTMVSITTWSCFRRNLIFLSILKHFLLALRLFHNPQVMTSPNVTLIYNFLITIYSNMISIHDNNNNNERIWFKQKHQKLMN